MGTERGKEGRKRPSALGSVRDPITELPPESGKLGYLASSLSLTERPSRGVLQAGHAEGGLGRTVSYGDVHEEVPPSSDTGRVARGPGWAP